MRKTDTTEINPHFKFHKDAVALIKKFVPKKNLKPESRGDLLNYPEFKTLMEVFPGILCFIDCYTGAYMYMSENVKSILGHDPQEFYEHGLKKTVTVFPEIHSTIILQKVFPTVFEHFSRYSLTGDVRDFRATYNSWMVRGDGTLGHYLHQLSVIYTGDTNEPHSMLKLITDISQYKKDDSITLTISKKDAKGIFHPVFTQNFLVDSSEQILSSREAEVLNLISQGKSSNEIGDLLCITENTVFRHRKNMLKKMAVKNTGELLSKAIANGII